MSQRRRSRRRASQALVIVLVLAILLVWAAGAYFFLKPRTDPGLALSSTLNEMQKLQADSAGDSPLQKAAASALSYTLEGEMTRKFRKAWQTVTVHGLDPQALTEGIGQDMQSILEGYVDQARLPSEVYDGHRQFLSPLVDKAYDEALSRRLERAEDYTLSRSLTVQLSYSYGLWSPDDAAALRELFSLPDQARPGYDQAAESLQYVRFRYKLDDLTGPGPIPNANLYGETTDPYVVSALLETREAQELINGQTLDWSPDIDFLPGSSINYYLDESILTIVWQQAEHGAVGTFAETIIADASQLRRKLANDSFGCMGYYYPTYLSAEANAVLALSGDFYDHPDRIYGVYAYNGQVMRTNLSQGEVCYFNTDGDMLFSMPGQFANDGEAQAFLDENHVMFSLSFGPVLINNGVDVTPDYYPLGEILDTYARCAVGQLGPLHYLSMTINCQKPDYYNLVTLRQAADSMIAHGCLRAYTLDGGQTGSIIIGNRLINPVQFGVERYMSDIFYFATAVPNS